MTENDWLTASDALPILRHAHRRAGGRKMRLFACACCRAIWPRLTDRRSRDAVEVAERFANGLVTEEELALTEQAAREVLEATGLHSAWAACGPPARDAEWGAWCAARNAPRSAVERGPWRVFSSDLIAGQAALLRDIIGNPFRPEKVDAAWLTPAVVGITCRIYEERDYAAMAVLADALLDAGCDSPGILGHCRQPGQVHARGCWVVDLLTGRS